MSTENSVIEKKKQRTQSPKDPGKYRVVVCNDDSTTIEFVVEMLMLVFRHSEQAAKQLTMTVHEQGKATVAVYPYEIAEQKAIDATNLARTNGFPLIVKVEPDQ